MRIKSQWTLFLLVAVAASCQFVSGVASLEIDEGLAAGAGGASVTSTTASSSSSGAGGCVGASDCSGVDALCRVRTCVEGACGSEFLKQGEQSLSQLQGDCFVLECGADGAVMQVPYIIDVYNDENECTVDSCDASGTSAHTPDAIGVDCEDSKFCNVAAECVECLTNNHCGVGACSAGRCVPASCADAQKNGNETDLDCGGVDCAPCADNKSCNAPEDCLSRVCLQGTKTCSAPTCVDNVTNGDESDLDCGGSSCAARCGDGHSCRYHSDCISGVCMGKSCAQPSCTDAVKNGAEAGVDCGGECGECM